MVNSVKFGPSIEDLSNPILITDTSKPKNKAKVKKMVVADPGLGMEIELESDSSISAFEITFKLGQESGTYHHQVNFTASAVSGSTMDLSSPFIFVVPFIDVHYADDFRIVHQAGETLHFEIDVIYYDQSLTPISSFSSYTGTLLTSMIKKDGKQFVGYLNGAVISGLQQDNPQSGGNAMAYSKVLFHQLGGAFDLQFPVGTTEISHSYNFLYKNGFDMPSNYEIQALQGKFAVLDKGFSWMPFPQSAESLNAESHISIEPWKSPDDHENIINLNFYPQTPFSGAEGSVVIMVE